MPNAPRVSRRVSVAAAIPFGDKISHASLGEGEGVVVAAATQGGAGEWVEVAPFRRRGEEETDCS